MQFSIWGVSAVALATAFGQAATAQEPPQLPPQQASDEIEQVIVTGTRVSGTTAAQSSTPIAVVGSDSLISTGLPTLQDELTRVVPSFSTPAFGSDTAALTTAAVLRGLSPNHVLVLVNGKRRHISANITADPGPTQGSNAVDLSLIPASAIDHIEVLEDGAAAQYGSDAIAGVINIILKNNNSGGSLSGTAGAYYGSPFPEAHDTGDGFRMDGMGNVGTELGETGFLNVTAEYNHHDNSNVTGAEFTCAQDVNNCRTGLPPNRFDSRIDGDPESSTETLEFNSGVDVDGLSFYSFGTYAHRHAKAFENYRTETKAAGLTLGGVPLDMNGIPLPNPYPLGFEPAETITEDDYSITAGIKSEILGWNWDLSSTYGADNDDIGNVGGLNIPLYQNTGFSPHTFRTGNLNNSEWTNNLDLTHPYDIGLAAPLNVAFGAEYRYETYQLIAGDPASRYEDGSQANPGFSLTDQHNVYRDSEGVYVDLSTRPIAPWLVDVAGRYENFSDFGDTEDGKVSTRYDIIPEFGVRATVSNGFRAPSLEQEYFSATNVGPGFADAQLPVNSAGAASLGAVPLKPEISNNYSAGLVAEPLPHLHMSVDAYQINIRNRIVDTATFTDPSNVTDGPVARAIALNGNIVEPNDTVGAYYFVNGLKTHTRGIEFSASYPQDYGDLGEVLYTVAANYNNTIALVSAGNTARYFGGGGAPLESSLSLLTTAAPKTKVILDASWTKDPWDVNLRGTYYGRSSTLDQNQASTNYLLDKIDPAFIVDLEIGYTLDDWHFAVGANNLFNTFPNKVNPDVTSPHSEEYNTYSAFGYQGGYYYTRITYNFGGTPEAAPAVPPPPPPPAPAPAPAPQPEAQREFQVFFDFDKSNITDAAAKVIQAAADVVKGGGIAHITVTGHTDTVGTAKYNQGLSERRAASVKTQLVTDGVSGGEISTVGVGKSGLLVPTKDGVREPQNRRAVIELQ